MSHNFDPFPKYLQIRDIITRELRGLDVGTRLPTEAQLAERFAVSRETIRQAIATLEADDDLFVKTNLTLLRNQDWIDIPVVYKSGRRALLTMEKGIPGEKVFDEALKAWQAKSSG